MSDIAIYWFRDDLRLNDLAGLAAAAERGPVVPLYIWDDQVSKEWSIGGASRWWLHKSLAALEAALNEQAIPLILRSGNTAAVLEEVCRSVNATAVYCSRQYQPWAGPLEQSLRDSLSHHDIELKRYPGTLLHEPESVATGAGTPFKVFTPFWRACLRRPEPQMPLTTPTLTPCPTPAQSETLNSWNLLPTQPNWAHGWEDLWCPGEDGGHAALDLFLADHVSDYGDGRDIPSARSTSRLSPYLRFGNISPRQVWHAAQASKVFEPGASSATDKFLSEIGWREFCYHLLFHFPTMPDEAFNPKFSYFPWGTDQQRLTAWQRGQTGYPIVDAGMRELWATGFMHNRVRMVVASFLTKHLLLHWREGEAWFWDCLLDADLASNACGWQWVGGSGADASPYFRIFNPIAQGEKFDKAGAYTRKWVPELQSVPDKFLHKPWEAPAEVLADAGVLLGENYPSPIVDHKTAREEALGAYATLKTLSV